MGCALGLRVGELLGLEEGLAVGSGVGFPGNILGTGVGLLEGVDGATVGRDDVGMVVLGRRLGVDVVGLDEVG